MTEVTYSEVPRVDKIVTLISEADAKKLAKDYSLNSDGSVRTNATNATKLAAAKFAAILTAQEFARNFETITSSEISVEMLNSTVTKFIENAQAEVLSAVYDRVLIENTDANRKALGNLMSVILTKSLAILAPNDHGLMMWSQPVAFEDKETKETRVFDVNVSLSPVNTHTAPIVKFVK